MIGPVRLASCIVSALPGYYDVFPRGDAAFPSGFLQTVIPAIAVVIMPSLILLVAVLVVANVSLLPSPQVGGQPCRSSLLGSMHLMRHGVV